MTTALDQRAIAIAEPTYDGDWLVEHARHIGSSDTAAILGVSPYRQAYEVWLEKTGRTEPVESTEIMRAGKEFEPPIAAKYRRTVDERLTYPVPMLESVEHPHLAATPDGMIEDVGRIVELKLAHWSRAARLGEEGTDEVFDDWLVQVHHQMIVTGFTEAHVYVCIDPHSFRLYQVVRNEGLVESILRRLADFWALVQADTAPEIDFGHRSARDILNTIRVTPTAAILDQPEFLAAANEYRALGDQIRNLESMRDARRMALQSAMGESAYADVVDPLGQPVYRLKRSQIEAKSYTVDRKAHTRLTVSEAKR